MQGEATIESFPSYPRQGPSTTTNILLALPFFNLLAVSEVFVKVAIGLEDCLARRELTAVAERDRAEGEKIFTRCIDLNMDELGQGTYLGT